MSFSVCDDWHFKFWNFVPKNTNEKKKMNKSNRFSTVLERLKISKLNNFIVNCYDSMIWFNSELTKIVAPFYQFLINKVSSRKTSLDRRDVDRWTDSGDSRYRNFLRGQKVAAGKSVNAKATLESRLLVSPAYPHSRLPFVLQPWSCTLKHV